MSNISANVLALFRKFDTAGKGTISREDLTKILDALAPGKYADKEDIDVLLGGSAGATSVTFIDFVSIIFGLHPLQLVFFGSPGCGNGTQCEILKRCFGVRHVNIGDVLREQVKKGSLLGNQAKEFMDKGELVPDDIMMSLLVDETRDSANPSWLIDGMPRTRVQAEAMAKMGFDPDLFVHLHCPDAVIEERIQQRRLDPVSGEIYNLQSKPPTDDAVKSRLVQLPADAEDKLKARLQAYHDNLDAVREFYDGRGTLLEVNGDQPVGVVTNRLLASILQSRLPPRTTWPLTLVMFGAPGSGKDTQCQKLHNLCNLKHISIEDAIVYHSKRGTPLGLQVKACTDAKQPVPDELLMSLLIEEVQDCPCGWLINGMPRTLAQAEAMARSGLDPQVFLNLEVRDEILEERITQRRVDIETGDIYNLKSMPPQDPEVAGRLLPQPDDTVENLRTRLTAHNETVAAMKGFYASRGSLVEVDGMVGGVDGVHTNLLTALIKSRLMPVTS